MYPHYEHCGWSIEEDFGVDCTSCMEKRSRNAYAPVGAPDQLQEGFEEANVYETVCGFSIFMTGKTLV